MMDSIICCKPVDTRDDGDSNAEESSAGDNDGRILECDYDSTCTKLYKMIEGKQWEEIIYFLETGKWYFDTTFLTSMIYGKGPSPRYIESRTWVTALDEIGNVRWCQLPLHAAITFQAPFDVITKLVKIYPESTRCADDQDMLPLHYAFRFGSEDNVLSHILEEFPQALRKKALRDRLPLDMAHYSSKPERGVIIECYVDTSIAEARACWEHDHRSLRSSVQTKTTSNLSHLKHRTVRSTERELFEAKKKIQELEEKLGIGRTGSPPGRKSTPRNIAYQRAGKEKRDEVVSLEPSEEISVDKKSKKFGKMFGRSKKQLTS
mmetsp:Transcript_19352/g.42096  ORF Transcript_19352/g.42096 Transcript_19352/m.42096 type:complete len:320 (-) Transcript_19352:189-1148(-)|eukprot:CAMPEP_0168191808 /NCGR_PEP_ID=MMETSP0139_2-20121125/17713_1 /TAXON_ID=44445 /ORGANISM="Pseudo-nitzschia australis, Strain 10249 10 AB" /LENGTH=319 /DNA_ID=CAMNT_0008115007 /DNA_START=276 /DNA_END=1235 /DNA_ORIENTATION=-